jgi:hypothetical protein
VLLAANETFQDVSRALFLEEILCSRYPMAGSCNMCNFGLRQFHHHRSSLSWCQEFAIACNSLGVNPASFHWHLFASHVLVMSRRVRLLRPWPQQHHLASVPSRLSTRWVVCMHGGVAWYGNTLRLGLSKSWHLGTLWGSKALRLHSNSNCKPHKLTTQSPPFAKK